MEKIYLDYNATTPCDPRVVETMLPWFYERPGNASSRSHPFGWEAEEAVKTATAQLSELLGVDERELIFTSGATESINLALRGVYTRYRRKGSHLVTVKTEHLAVLDLCAQLEQEGAEVTYLDVDADGHLDLDALRGAIREDTVLVAVMWANNETGVVHPMQKIGAICAEKGTLLFSDATQAVGKLPVDPVGAGVHLLACSAHKMYGPKGVGALYVRRRNPRVALAPLLVGGGHQGGLRSGTLNVPGIVGMGKAAEIAAAEMAAEADRLRPLRDRLETELLQSLEASRRNGCPTHRLPHVSNLAFRFVSSETLLMRFSQFVAVSTGSACSSATLEPSHVLLAMGLEAELAKSSIRISLGRFTTPEEIDYTIKAIRDGVTHLRAANPVWSMWKDGIVK